MSSDDNRLEWKVKKVVKPWIVVDPDGEIFQFDTHAEAAAFAKAEQEQWDEDYCAYLRRKAEEEKEEEEEEEGEIE